MKAKRADLLLKIIAAARGESVTPAQLQKVAFLLGQEFPDEMPDNYYQFQKYDYGPFDVKIYRDAEKLQSKGLVSIAVNSRGGWKEYAATKKGLSKTPEDVSEAVAEYIDQKVRWARGLSFQELVRAVYREFPAYRENSVFQD